jgi:cholesterol 25-hydroxylase
MTTTTYGPHHDQEVYRRPANGDARVGNYHHAAAAIAANTSTSSYRSTFLVPELHNITDSLPLQTQRALPELPPTSCRTALGLIASFFPYDALFFLLHFSLHVLFVI